MGRRPAAWVRYLDYAVKWLLRSLCARGTLSVSPVCCDCPSSLMPTTYVARPVCRKIDLRYLKAGEPACDTARLFLVVRQRRRGQRNRGDHRAPPAGSCRGGVMVGDQPTLVACAMAQRLHAHWKRRGLRLRPGQPGATGVRTDRHRRGAPCSVGALLLSIPARTAGSLGVRELQEAAQQRLQRVEVEGFGQHRIGPRPPRG